MTIVAISSRTFRVRSFALTASAKLVGKLEKDNAAALADFRTAQTDAANDHFEEKTETFVD